METDVTDRLAEDARAEVRRVARDLKRAFDMDARELPREVLFSIGAAIDELDPLPGAGLPLPLSDEAPPAGAEALVLLLTDARDRLTRSTADLPLSERLGATVALCELGRWRAASDVTAVRDVRDPR